MTPAFFPDTTFAWLFYGLLVAGCLLAVITDLKWQRLPNYITVPLCLLGLVMNLIRASWLGQLGEAGHYFGLAGIFGGLFEGLCFSIAGFAVAFALFVLLFTLRKCGAGDVKLMAAVGAWVGPLWFLFIFAGTIVAVIPILLAWWGYAYATRHNPGLKLSFALPSLFSVGLLLLWLWRKTLLA